LIKKRRKRQKKRHEKAKSESDKEKEKEAMENGAGKNPLTTEFRESPVKRRTI